MRRSFGIALLCFALVLLLAGAGCITSQNQDTDTEQSLNPASQVGELRGMYLNYVDEKSGDSWWATMKTKVGSSVLSLKSPKVSVSEMELSDEKREILETALKLCGLSINPGTGFALAKLNASNEADTSEFSLKDLFALETASESPKNLQFWTEYSMSRYPYFGIGGISKAEWNRVWPVLQKALLDAVGYQSGE